MLNGSLGGTLPASIDFKQLAVDTVSYNKVQLGPEYIPDLYQYETEYMFLLSTDKDFDKNSRYFK